LRREDIDMPGGVFISYRREDSGGFAGRIYDRLVSRLGHESVFFDVDAIPPGRDFIDVLSERVGRCDALVAIIGKQWVASVDGANRRRLDDEHDFVRVEIEAALERGVPVIPVLVDGAQPPQAADLPDSLKKLARRQAIEISHTRFDSDAERLTDALAEIEGQRQDARPEAPSTTGQSEAPPARARAVVAAPAAVGAVASSGLAPPASAPPKPASRRFLPYLAVAVLIGAAGAVWLVAGHRNRPSDEWLTLSAFQADFNKKKEAGLYPDASSGRCDGRVVKTNAHWAPTPQGLSWSHYSLPEAAFATKNAQLTAEGYSLRYDNMFQDCDGHVRHVALWTRSAAGTKTAQAGVEHFVGDWINIDVNTRSVSKLSVTLASKDVSVHAWGACQPTPCDWGEVKADAFAENVSSNALSDATVLQGVFKTSFAETNFSVRLDGQDKLRFETATHFTDNSGRSNYSSTDIFKRAQ
jgi:TIR domain